MDDTTAEPAVDLEQAPPASEPEPTVDLEQAPPASEPEPTVDLEQAPPASEPEPTEPPPVPAVAEQPVHSDALDTAAAAKPATGAAEEPRDVADNLQPAGVSGVLALAAGSDVPYPETPIFGLLADRTPPDKGVRAFSPDDAVIWGVKGLSRAWFPGSFCIWHLDLPEHTTSDALAADVLSPAANDIQRGDVIFVTTKDGTLLRSMSVRGGKVCLAPVI